MLVDPKGDGDYLQCVDIADVGLSEGWGRKAYVGLTAATGQLSGEMRGETRLSWAKWGIFECGGKRDETKRHGVNVSRV